MKNKVLTKNVKTSKKSVIQIAREVGVTRMTIYNYMDNLYFPNVHIANSLARLFKTTTEELFPYYSKPKDQLYNKI